MENLNREVGVVYTSSSFSLSKNTVHIGIVENHIDFINKKDKLYLNYIVMSNLISRCKNKHDNDSREVILLKNYPFIRVHIRNIFIEILEPLILNNTLKDKDEIIITGLETIDDQLVNTIQVVTENSDYFYNLYGIKLKYLVLLKEIERF